MAKRKAIEQEVVAADADNSEKKVKKVKRTKVDGGQTAKKPKKSTKDGSKKKEKKIKCTVDNVGETVEQSNEFEFSLDKDGEQLTKEEVFLDDDVSPVHRLIPSYRYYLTYCYCLGVIVSFKQKSDG